MPNEIIRYGDDSERKYVLWSSVTESPHTWGTKEELVEYLLRREHPLNNERARVSIAERFERADGLRRTSRMWGEPVTDDEIEIFEQRGMLRMKNLPAFLASYDDKNGFDLSLLEPFDEDTPVRMYEDHA